MAGITAFAYAVLFRGSLYDGVAAFFAGAIALGIMSVFAMFRIVKRKKL